MTPSYCLIWDYWVSSFRLLRLVVLRWRYFYPPPYGVTAAVLLSLRIPLSIFLISGQSYITTDRQSTSVYWCQDTIRPRDQFFFLLEIFCRQLQVSWLRLWREDWSVIYCCCWASPEQSLSSLSPEGLRTIFHCSNFCDSPVWRARSPYLYFPATMWPSYTPGHCVPFPSHHMARRATVEVFYPAPHGVFFIWSWS
jgi:hypothetical protein